MDEYDFKYVKLFVQECEAIASSPNTDNQQSMIESFKSKIQKACSHWLDF